MHIAENTQYSSFIFFDQVNIHISNIHTLQPMGYMCFSIGGLRILHLHSVMYLCVRSQFMYFTRQNICIDKKEIEFISYVLIMFSNIFLISWFIGTVTGHAYYHTACQFHNEKAHLTMFKKKKFLSYIASGEV